MKKYINSIMAVLVLASVFSACEKEPEVGDTLYPADNEETYGVPKVYINETDLENNSVSLNMAQTPVELVLPSQEVSFMVKLTKALDRDITVTVAENPSLGGDDAVSGAVNIQNPTVTIPAGKMVSDEPVRMTVNDTEDLRKCETATSVVTIASVSDPDVLVGKNYNAVYVKLTKVYTNFKGQSRDELKEMTRIDLDDVYIECNGRQQDGSALNNGVITSSDYVYFGSAFDVIIHFDEPQSFRALGYCWGFSYYYCPSDIDILTSDDGETWVSQLSGGITNSYVSSTITNVIPVVLYSPVTCSYVKFSAKKGYYYSVPCMSEIMLYR